MLTEDQIRIFLLSKNINFDANIIISTDEASKLLNLIRDTMNHSFAHFIEFCFFNQTEHETNLILNFTSWDDLYECYIEFMIGYFGFRA